MNNRMKHDDRAYVLADSLYGRLISTMCSEQDLHNISSNLDYFRRANNPPLRAVMAAASAAKRGDGKFTSCPGSSRQIDLLINATSR